MSLLIERDHAAEVVLVSVIVVAAAAEVAATYLGQARDGRRKFAESVTEVLLLVRRRDGVAASDRWTEQVLIAALLCGVLLAYAAAAGVPALRVAAG